MSDPSNPSPSPTARTAIDEWREIKDSLAREVARLQALNDENARRLATPSTSPAPVATTGAMADDADLDGQWGDPVVRKNPPRWQGEDCSGRTYSQCPADFLEMLAGLLDWQAGKAAEKNEMTTGGKPRAAFLARDAARARGWMRRILAGPRRGVQPRRPNVPDPADLDMDVPF